MASPIQTRPSGLLGLLQLKQTGTNPSELLSTVQPHIDLFQNYVQSLMQVERGLFGGVPATASIGTAQNGFQNFNIGGLAAQVPQNEQWWVEACSTDPSGIAAADNFKVAVGYAFTGVSGWYPLVPAWQDTITARARFGACDPMPRAVMVPPGAQFLLLVYDIVTAGGISFNLFMRAARIPI